MMVKTYQRSIVMIKPLIRISLVTAFLSLSAFVTGNHPGNANAAREGYSSWPYYDYNELIARSHDHPDMLELEQ